MIDRPTLQREVERIHLRYQIEVVEALGLCPWAREARLDGRVAMAVSFLLQPMAAEAMAVVEQAMADERVEVGIVVFPALALERLPFQHFAAELRERHAAISGRGNSRFALADFHPIAEIDRSSPERLVPFLRRAPDPMLQVVRTRALEAVRLSEDQGTSFVDPSQHDLAALLSTPAPTPSLASRVANNNARTIERIGAEQVAALIVDILHDRNSSYAALGLTTPRWT
jgi:hypothetical protein